MSPRAQTWLGRAALAAWLGLGVLALRLAPEPEPPDPELAELAFGARPSMGSSAPSGTLALARALERFGFEVVANRSTGRPDADALLLLEPEGALSVDEAEALAAWVRDGGRLLYAPSWAADAPPSDDLDGDAGSERASDPLLVALEAEAAGGSGAPTSDAHGRGRWALLPAGAGPLTNEAIAESGLAPALPVLRELLEGTQRVAFDELRLDLVAPEDIRDQLLRSRFGAGALGLALALAVYLFARAPRREPVVPEPPGRGRVFAEHLDAVGRLLEAGSRRRLSGAGLVEGTRRRLGPLARSDRARATLDEVARRLDAHDGSPLAPDAAALVALERELLGAPRGPSPGRALTHHGATPQNDAP